MSLRINQNILSLDSYKTLSSNSARLEKSIKRLSSGLRINTAADDAAGLAMSEKMRRQIRGLSRAVSNAQDGVSMVQTAEGALNESQNILHRMRELAIQSANDTLTSNDRLEIQKEIEQLKGDLNRIATSTEFNTVKLLNGSQTALLSSSSNAVRGYVVGDVNEGGMYAITVETAKGGISQMLQSQIFTKNDASGNLAEGNTQLQSIAQFYNDDGVFVLDTPQSLTFYGNGNETLVHLDGQMSLDNLAAAIQNAITRDSGLGIKNTKVATVTTAQSKVANVGGYIQIISGAIGEAGSVLFSSDQKVMDSLGITISREAVESRSKLVATNGFGDYREVIVDGNRARGLLKGVDIQFESQAAQIASTRGLEHGLLLSSSTTGDLKFTISAGGKSLEVTLEQGAWTMEGLIRNLNAQFDADTGIVGLRASLVDGEIRMMYERPVSVSNTIPGVIRIIDSTDAAKTIGFIEGEYNGFVDGQKDQKMVRWGFSTYANKTGATTGDGLILSVGDGQNDLSLQVALYSSVAKADMKVFSDFQTEFNKTANENDVKVRVDQVGSSMVFTSLRVGTERIADQDDVESRIVLNFNSAAGVDDIIQKLGYQTGMIARGTGDTNFQFQVIDRSSQLQIGPDRGHSMKFGIAEMTAEALGVNQIDVTSISGANKAMGAIDKAIDTISTQRSRLGAVQNRLEYTINNLRNSHSNLSASESRIRDADIALEMIEFTRNQIISQSGTAMLAQANMVPQGVLQLLT